MGKYGSNPEGPPGVHRHNSGTRRVLSSTSAAPADLSPPMPRPPHHRSRNRSGPVVGQGGRRGVLRRYLDLYRDPDRAAWKKVLLGVGTAAAFFLVPLL